MIIISAVWDRDPQAKRFNATHPSILIKNNILLIKAKSFYQIDNRQLLRQELNPVKKEILYFNQLFLRTNQNLFSQTRHHKKRTL